MSKQIFNVEVKTGTSRARDTYGYLIVSLYIDGKKVASCNGGGYDMEGTVFGSWIAKTFPDALRKLVGEFYGLTWHNPNYKTPATIEQAEKDGRSLGLERYQAFYKASSKVPTDVHTIPSIDGACGMSSVERILEAIGGKIRWIKRGKKTDVGTVEIIENFDSVKMQRVLTAAKKRIDEQREEGVAYENRSVTITEPLNDAEREYVARYISATVNYLNAIPA